MSSQAMAKKPSNFFNRNVLAQISKNMCATAQISTVKLLMKA